MTNTRNVKVWICVACLATSMAAPAYQPMPLALDIIDMAAISRMTPQQLEALAEGLAAEEVMRTKRSSAQALSSVVSKASSSIPSKLGLLGQASAGAVSFIASASSKSGSNDEHGYSYEPQESKVDFWGLKKSILYTLFQAVKAITGGVTILKGQLIKGGGALASTVAKVIASKGDAVSNLGKKIVSSAALSEKKPHSTAVYGPPPPSHVEYGPPPSAYGAPTAPAHFTHTGPTGPTGFAPHKYPVHLDDNYLAQGTDNRIHHALHQSTPLYFPNIGGGKLNGVHAGLVILTPLADGTPSESYHPPAPGHTPLEPPPSILHTAFSAIKNVFSSVAPAFSSSEPELESHQPPPPPQPIPPFKPMAWEGVNSYGEPTMIDAYPDYDPRNPHRPFDYASSKHSVAPPRKTHGLTRDKIQKISTNLNKLALYMNNNVQRSSEDMTQYNTVNSMFLKKGPMLPTPVVTDNEIGVLPAEFLPEPITTTTTTTTTTIKPKTQSEVNATESDKNRRKKEIKYILRGNRIVLV